MTYVGLEASLPVSAATARALLDGEERADRAASTLAIRSERLGRKESVVPTGTETFNFDTFWKFVDSSKHLFVLELEMVISHRSFKFQVDSCSMCW